MQISVGNADVLLIMLLIKIQLHEKGRLPLFGRIC